MKKIIIPISIIIVAIGLILYIKFNNEPIRETSKSISGNGTGGTRGGSSIGTGR